MKNILTEALVNSATNASFIFSYTNSAKLRILSINLDGYKSDELAEILNEDYDICVRSGYHCAPLVHDFLDSKKYNGTVRISISSFTSKEEINNLILALEEIGQ